MFPFCESQNAMDTPLYQQLQLSPPSPRPDQAFYYPYPYPYASPPFATESFHLNYLAAAADVPQAPAPPPEQLAIMGGLMAPQNPEAAVSGAAACERAATKDRHSKICTAGGMRDRRMRLSLDVARKFFALQDMLGFDKASKTVQWLLHKSKAAIRELVSTTSPSSAGDDASSLSNCKDKPRERGERAASTEAGKKPKAKRSTAPKTPRRSAAYPAPDKESRAKARERARERTREKNRLRWATLASTVAVEAAPGGEESGSHNLNLAMSEVDERCSSSLNSDTLHGKMQEISMTSESSDTIRAFEYGDSTEHWELGGVVFANAWPRY